MTTHHINEISHWFKEAVPAPTDDNRQVQLGVHFEEVAEMAAAVGFMSASDNVANLANLLKKKFFQDMNVDRIELLDSLCDQIVTAIGVAHMYGMDISGALNEVNRSNWSKFKDGKPVFDANGKIAKNKDTYFKPSLEKFAG